MMETPEEVLEGCGLERTWEYIWIKMTCLSVVDVGYLSPLFDGMALL
jgi:hypothetical protein